MINSLSLPGYQLVDSDEQNEDIHFRLEAPTPVACEGCGVQGEFVRFGKRDVPYRDLPIHGKRVTLWVVRRRYTCRACKTTFRPQLPEMVDGFRMTLRLHEYVEKESFNHPYTFVAAQTGLDEKTVRDIFNARAEFLGRWHRFETPRILGIDELYLNKRYRCILTNIEERTLLDLLATRRQDVVTNYLMKLKDRQKVEIVSMDMWNPYRAAVKAVLPQARIVVDKFHVVRMANDALERVRKGLRKELKPSQSRTLGDWKILLKRAHEVSDRASYGDLDRRVPATAGRLRAQGALLRHLGTPAHGSGRSRPGRVDSHHPEGPKGSLERSGQGSGKLARRDHDLLRDGHARHQRLHGVHQPTGQGQEP
jgi:transposase